MSLIEYIENLQRKPRHVRLQIMWVGSVLGAAVIFIFWLWSLTSLLAQPSKTNNGSDKVLQSLNEIKQEAPGLWQSLSAGISEVINTAKSELNSSPTPAQDNLSNQNNQPEVIEKLPIE